MSSNSVYRASPPRRSPTVIRTRGVASSIGASAAVLLTLCFVMFAASGVELACSRAPGGGVCEARTRSLFGVSTVQVPLADVQRATLDEDDGASCVAVVMWLGQVPLTSQRESFFGAGKAAMITAVNRFVVDRSRSTLSASYGLVWIERWMALPLIALFLGVLAFLMRPLNIVVDRDGGVLRVVRTSFPWTRRGESFALVPGAHASVVTDHAGESVMHRVALVLADGKTAPLTPFVESARSVRNVVEKINAALAPDEG